MRQVAPDEPRKVIGAAVPRYPEPPHRRTARRNILTKLGYRSGVQIAAEPQADASRAPPRATTASPSLDNSERASIDRWPRDVAARAQSADPEYWAPMRERTLRSQARDRRHH